MTKVHIHRIAFLPTATVGRLLLEGTDPLWTLEPPLRNNLRSVSCIPEGTYEVVPFDSKKHGKVMEVTKVPGRSAILFHALNRAKETQGCIGTGLGFGLTSGEPRISGSRSAMSDLISLATRTFTLTITSGAWDYELKAPVLKEAK